MTPKNWLLFIAVFYFCTNIFLFILIKKREKKLDVAVRVSQKWETIADYAYDNGQISRLFDSTLIPATSESFVHSIRQVRALVDTSLRSLPKEYFGKKISANAVLQRALSESLAEYVKACHVYLDKEIPERQKRISLYTTGFRDQIARTGAAAKMQSNTKQGKIPIQAYQYLDYLSRINNLDSSYSFLRSKALLKKLESAMITRGKIKINQNEYTLVDITPAEMELICKYLLWLKIELETNLIETRRTESGFF